MAVAVTVLFDPTQLTGSAATLFTLNATPSTLVLARGRIRFTNTDSASHAVTAYAIKSGGSATAATCFLNAEPVAQNTHLDVDIPNLGPGGFVQAFADKTSTVTAFPLDGVLIS